MWHDFNKITDVMDMASVWLLTLEKQGCSTMLKAGTIFASVYSPAAVTIVHTGHSPGRAEGSAGCGHSKIARVCVLNC